MIKKNAGCFRLFCSSQNSAVAGMKQVRTPTGANLRSCRIEGRDKKFSQPMRVRRFHQRIETRNNYDRINGIPDSEITKLFRDAVMRENERKKSKGIPIAKYDREKNAAYLEYPNGNREYLK